MTHAVPAEERHRLTTATGIDALALDALASGAYGPESIVVALAVAGAAGIAFTLPVTLVIVALLGVLVLSYRQVIAAYPDGGGAYTVARDNLGLSYGLVAAASLVVDYVLNVAVSVAAGVAALTSAFPVLLPWTVKLCLAVLLCVAAINLRGVVAGGRAFALPAVVFVGSLVVLIVVGLVRGAPLAPLPGPSFRTPRRQRARRAEAGLGIVLGALLIGLAVRDRQVYRTSIVVLTVLSGALLLASAGQVAVLVPLFAIGVFVGFTLCQVGMLRHWWADRSAEWRSRGALNGFGAVLTGVAAVVLVVEKFTEGAWLIVLVIPVLVAGFQSVRRAYDPHRQGAGGRRPAAAAARQGVGRRRADWAAAQKQRTRVA